MNQDPSFFRLIASVFRIILSLPIISVSFTHVHRLQATHQSRLQSLREKFQEEKDALARHHKSTITMQHQEVREKTAHTSPCRHAIRFHSLTRLILLDQ